AGGLTHYFFAFFVFAAAGWILLDDRVRSGRRNALLAMGAGAAVAACWLPFLLTQYKPRRFWWIGSIRWRYVLAVPLRLFTHAREGTPSGLVLSASACALLVGGCVLLGRRSA